MTKFRLILEADSKKKHPLTIKLNIPPSKTQGFVNFINRCTKEDNTIQIYFEKIDGKQSEKSKVTGMFQFREKTIK